jgi:hypothetical protein
MIPLELSFERARYLARTLFVSLIVLFSVGTVRSYGQGTLHFTFDGPPPIAPGSAELIEQYAEFGWSFTPISSMGLGFARIGTQPRQERPDNGTIYLQAGLGSTLRFSSLNISLFDLQSVDLAEYSTVAPDAVTVRFVGYRPDGSTVITDLTTDGIIDGTGPSTDFQTFEFGPQWSGLTRVEIPTPGWSLDNLVVSIPEPSTRAVLLGGSLLFLALQSRRVR